MYVSCLIRTLQGTVSNPPSNLKFQDLHVTFSHRACTVFMIERGERRVLTFLKTSGSGTGEGERETARILLHV